MGLIVCVKSGKADKLFNRLLSSNILDKKRQIKRNGRFVYFPVKNNPPYLKVFNARIVGKQINENLTLSKYLSRWFSASKIDKLRKSFEIVGHIIILELDKSLVKHEKKIAEYLLEHKPFAKTIVKKAGGHTGKFRIQKYSFILGERRFEAIHAENGVKISLDIRKSYFSPRSSGERLRIAKLVKPRERILVLFSGVAPYPLVISRNSKASEIIGIEMNKEAHHYARRNLVLNKIKNIKLILGDAGKEIPKLKGKFDRIVMPLPKHADRFLIKAFSKIKNRGWIHFYDFSRDFESTRIKIRESAQKAGVKVLIRRIVKCGQQSPGVFRVCADIQVTFS